MWSFLKFLVVLPFVLSKTVIIGDSMFAGGSTIPSLLIQWSGDKEIENYARVGASLIDGWVLSIPKQYELIPDKSNISTLIMDGGGNDVFSLRRDCAIFNQKCKDRIHESIGILDVFLENVSAQNIIYLGFYYARGMNQAVDEGMEALSQVCREDDVIPCFLVDPRNFSLPLGWDGVHPTNEGYQRLATAIWDTALLHNVEI